VRDEIRLQLRSGPGNEYRIIKVLKTGDEVARLEQQDAWLRVRIADGSEGWVPDGFTSAERPARLELPAALQKLHEAEARLTELESRAAQRAEASQELDQLRARVSELETENARLSIGTSARMLLAGGVIAFVGVLAGLWLPRGSSRARRLKL
jgi:SH3 domain protein